MTKFLGIDYGAKKIGLAVSDDGGQFAFPEAVIKSDKKAIGQIARLCREKKINEVVLGEPASLVGSSNAITEETNSFRAELQRELKLPIHSQKEFMTSTAARHMESYIAGARPNTARKTRASSADIDDSAAAIILQRYLDRLNNKENNPPTSLGTSNAI